jgi:hypothetical protein
MKQVIPGSNALLIDDEGNLLVKKITAVEGGTPGSASWGGIGGTLSAQTDLQGALDAKLATGHTSDFNHSLLHGNSLDHSNSSDHAAGSDNQNLGDITKEQIEAKLTGEIATHTHAGGGGGLSQPQVMARSLGC